MLTISLIEESLLLPVPPDERYVDSPFIHLKQMQPKQKGSRMEKIVRSVFLKVGREVKDPTSTDYDMLLDGEKCEIKGSTLQTRGKKSKFSFLQIRPDQDYDCILFVMFYPQELIVMRMNKETAQARIEDGTLRKQHGGKAANSRTFCYFGNEEDLLNIGATKILQLN